jgi:uncharacterized protein (TIGR00369 family)
MTVERANALCAGTFAEVLGVRFFTVSEGRTLCRADVRPELLAPNGYLHGSSVIGLAETACGIGTMFALDAVNGGRFATIDLSCNFLGTAREGAIRCEATRAHSGRTTQVWDAQVYDEASGGAIALVRCTQLVLRDR